MLNWLRNRRKLLFRYWDGRRWRRADPFLLWRKLFSDPTVNLMDLLPAADDGKDPETTQAVELICRVFGAVRWDEATETGLTDWEVLGLLNEFHAYMHSLKKSTNPGPTSPPPTDSGSSPSPERPPDATSGPSDSGSAPDDATPAGPPSLPEASRPA